jgi:tRNA nucleotidyltransferase (CCA-adding enzyme)
MPTNRLINSTSPYLLQHAHNPVDWYPFGEEALAQAHAEDKPIFLSIGYAACHWCHVMERESFENPSIAALMNRDFVCIKVDREERPDLDEIYMAAVVAMTDAGGWPMSLFLTPDLQPFYGGTYYPPDDYYGRPGFKRVLAGVAEAWKQRHDAVVSSAAELTAHVRERLGSGPLPGAAAQPLHPSLLDGAEHALAQNYDTVDGGWGPAPKFPSSGSIELLLRHVQRTGDAQSLRMVLHTLNRMARGGMYDQLGGGFHRYSTDGQWLVPHFEKMLYDNAQLAVSYLEAAQVTGSAFYRRIAAETLDYVLRDLTGPQGEFLSSEDADSEGQEGRFYLWTKAEVMETLGPEEGSVFVHAYGVEERGNFGSHEPYHAGQNILHLAVPLEDTGDENCALSGPPLRGEAPPQAGRGVYDSACTPSVGPPPPRAPPPPATARRSCAPGGWRWNSWPPIPDCGIPCTRPCWRPLRPPSAASSPGSSRRSPQSAAGWRPLGAGSAVAFLSYTRRMRTPELIATHTNTDFDGFAAMVAVHKLYPEAHLCLGGAVNRNVREFQALYADRLPVVDPVDVEHDSVRRLIMVDTVHPTRLGDLAELCGTPGVQVLAFDHHASAAELPSCIAPQNLVTSHDGSLVTLLVHLIAERGIPISAFEATVFALGIHEDTGSLAFSTTTVRDAQALALCMHQGADTALLEKWLTDVLSPAQRQTLAAALQTARELPIEEATVLLAALHQQVYVEGVSVVAHRIMELTGCDACFLLVAMEDRIFATGRSRGGRLDVARVLAAVGGGGHRAAASAVIREQSLDDVADAIARAVPAAVAPVRRARDVLTPGFPVVDLLVSIEETAILCHRDGLGGVVVADGDLLVGHVALSDLERAAAHGLGHAPVKAVMTSRLAVVEPSTPLERVAELIAQDGVGWALVAEDADAGPVRRARVLGAVTRRAVAAAPSGEPEAPAPVAANLAGRLAELGRDEVLRHIQAVAANVRGVYLVGGAVRDLLLGEPGFDIDIAVEGDGIAFADELARRLKGHVRPHHKFGTAIVIYDDAGGRQHVDVASTRTESYAYPAALPKVEHAGIRSDLARRDFTINALAVSLKPGTYGDLLDYFGGVEDLARRQVVVLHNLSFIEDPTRILRAIRYENRYGLRMDEHTVNLARACCAMDLVGDLSSARLREELLALLDECRIDFSLQRIADLGLTPSIHARLDTGPAARAMVRRADVVRAAHGLQRDVPLWRLRLVLLLHELEPGEIAAWTERMTFRHSDAEVLAGAMVLGRRLLERVGRGPSEAELYELAKGAPLEAVVAAMVLDEAGGVAARLGRYLDVTRHVRLEIGGADLLALGLGPSPRLGEILHSVLALKLNGVVTTRAEELAVADQLAVAP